MSTCHYRHLFALFLIFCFLISGCETEPIAQNEAVEEPLSLNEAFKLAFSLSSFEDPTGHIIESIEVDWHTFQVRSLEGKKWYEFDIKQKQPVAFTGEGEIQGQFFTLLAHKNEDGIKFFVNKMLSFSAGEGYTYFNIAERHYHGMLYLYNLKGQVEYVHHYEKGELMSGIEDVLIDPHNTEKLGLATASRCNYKASAKPCSGNNCGKSGAYSSPTSPCGGRGNGGGNGGYTQVTTHHYTDWYNNRGSYSEYSHTQYNGSSSEWVWVSRGGSSGASSSRSSQNFAMVSANGRTYYTSRKPSSNSSNPEKIIVDYTLKITNVSKRSWISC
ncbi:hypothetical protein [uncultured Croceitalea sp.]|uniref:hypothetical protein n=1 Tax=uncultured Croceitalea sp. TaxID=1798908 RepID=UPI00330601B2